MGSIPIARSNLLISRSSDGAALKAALPLADGLAVETVLLRPSARRWTACLSTQVGCALRCSFCATGLMGLQRDLTADEIVGQVEFWKLEMSARGLGGGPDNLVFMGMGEPLVNYEATAETLRRLTAPGGGAFGPSRIAVSTAGIASGIERMAAEFPKVNLAVSLHAAGDKLRDRLVPVNKAYPLSRLAESLRRHLKACGRKILLEWVLLRGENDRPEDADALERFIDAVGPAELLHVNLIVFNPTPTPHSPTPEADARAFQARLRAAGLKATVRKNLGREVAGACGQLALLTP